MIVAGLGVGGLAERARQELVTSACGAALTYDHVGSTLDPSAWDDATMHTQRIELGDGAVAFAAARAALRAWVPQRGIGAEIVPPTVEVAPGETVVLLLRRGPLFVLAPDRIVAVVDEPRRFAYAYGTLPGHHECGEESFDVEWRADDSVALTIRVQAGPGTVAAHVAAPLVRFLQRAALRRYLDAVAHHVNAERARQ